MRTAAGVSPGAEERDDTALLRAVARGDEESLAALYDHHELSPDAIAAAAIAALER